MYAKLCTKGIRQSQATLCALSVWQQRRIIPRERKFQANYGSNKYRRDQAASRFRRRREKTARVRVLMSDPRNATPIRLGLSNYRILLRCPGPRGRLFSQDRAAPLVYAFWRVASRAGRGVTGREKKGDALIKQRSAPDNARASHPVRERGASAESIVSWIARGDDANCSRAPTVEYRSDESEPLRDDRVANIK